jgi:uncharacterized protein YodC (DUF2158 family)
MAGMWSRAMSKFEKGDLVKLRSGGPVMTVADFGDYGPVKSKNGVKCVWFEKTKNYEEVFDEAVLEKTSPSGPIGSLRISRV